MMWFLHACAILVFYACCPNSMSAQIQMVSYNYNLHITIFRVPIVCTVMKSAVFQFKPLERVNCNSYI